MATETLEPPQHTTRTSHCPTSFPPQDSCPSQYHPLSLRPSRRAQGGEEVVGHAERLLQVLSLEGADGSERRQRVGREPRVEGRDGGTRGGTEKARSS